MNYSYFDNKLNLESGVNTVSLRNLIIGANKYKYKAKKLYYNYKILLERANQLSLEINRYSTKPKNNINNSKMISIKLELEDCQNNLMENTYEIQDSEKRSKEYAIQAINFIKLNNIPYEIIAQEENKIIINLLYNEVQNLEIIIKQKMHILIGIMIETDKKAGKAFQENNELIEDINKNINLVYSVYQQKNLNGTENSVEYENIYLGNKLRLDSDVKDMTTKLKRLEDANNTILRSLNYNLDVLKAHKEYDKARQELKLIKNLLDEQVESFQFSPNKCEGVVTTMINYNLSTLNNLSNNYVSSTNEIRYTEKEKNMLYNKIFLLQNENIRLKNIINLSLKRINLSKILEKRMVNILSLSNGLLSYSKLKHIYDDKKNLLETKNNNNTTKSKGNEIEQNIESLKEISSELDELMLLNNNNEESTSDNNLEQNIESLNLELNKIMELNKKDNFVKSDSGDDKSKINKKNKKDKKIHELQSEIDEISKKIKDNSEKLQKSNNTKINDLKSEEIKPVANNIQNINEDIVNENIIENYNSIINKNNISDENTNKEKKDEEIIDTENMNFGNSENEKIDEEIIDTENKNFENSENINNEDEISYF